jgi:hypothetical protein
MKTKRRYIFFLVVFLLFISCTPKEKNVVALEPLVENLEKNVIETEPVVENVEKNVVAIDPPHAENLGNNLRITIGDVVVFVPSDYYIGYFDGDIYQGSTILDNDSEKYFYIMTDRNNDFAGADANYITRLIPLLQDYIDGTGDDMLQFPEKYRRNVYNNIKVAERLSLGEYEAINIIFTREISFIYNDIAYRFTVFIGDIRTQFINEMEDYFEIKDSYSYSDEEPYGWIIKKLDELYVKYKNYEELPLAIEQLFIETNIIYNSIEIRK